MGLWGLRKKRTDDTTANSPSEFYSKCIADFHKEALTYNVAQKGLIFIPCRTIPMHRTDEWAISEC